MAVAHKGSISMGLVLIPVGMYKATIDNDIHFNQLDKESKARIRYKSTAATAEKRLAAKISSKDMNMKKTGMWS